MSLLWGDPGWDRLASTGRARPPRDHTAEKKRGFYLHVQNLIFRQRKMPTVAITRMTVHTAPHVAIVARGAGCLFLRLTPAMATRVTSANARLLGGGGGFRHVLRRE